MSEMVERVARAIEEKLGELTSGDYSLNYRHPDGDGELASEIVARAAVEAMREPTEAMLEAADRLMGVEEDGFPSPRSAYIAMIDSALHGEGEVG